jgi:UDP-N-acetylglucosamine 1-carboxyvinyltransferase
MATENALMAAALTPGSTVIHNAASEPHVQDLARLLMQMGARIEGIGSNLMIIHGQEELHGADFAIGPDHIEIGSFIALAACTGGELRIRDCVPDDLRMTRLAFERLGCRIEYDAGDVLELLADTEVDLVLSGHKHVPYSWKLENMPASSGACQALAMNALVAASSAS